MLLDPETGAQLLETAHRQESYPACHPEVGGYKFPERSGADRAPDANNCATYPRRLGIPIPEPTGSMRDYMPELDRWATADAPVDSRTKEPQP
ncbi:MAG: hypothetical protein K8W52_10210 [Deltaproteobacteria bacterium]|nr:hypothetical protein [Deltaproteobacteria bacterium]